MADGLWGLIGVIIGSILSIVSQYLFHLQRERLENRKEYLSQIDIIEDSIQTLKNGINQILNIIEIDLSQYSEDELYSELNQTLDYLSLHIVEKWPKLKINIINFFPSIYLDKKFKFLEYSIMEFNFNQKRIKNITDGIFFNLIKHFKDKKIEFEQSYSIIIELEKKYNHIIKKMKRKLF
jgi:signal transduction histidine kinase